MTTTINPPKTLPGPDAPLGRASAIYHQINLHRDLITNLSKHHQRFGELSGAYQPVKSGDQTSLLGFGPRYNQQVLSNPAVFYTPLADILPPQPPAIARLIAGVLFMNGDIHRRSRRLLMPAFHKRYIESYRDDMVRLTERMLDRWQAGESRDIAREFHYLTMHIATRTLFGVDITDADEGQKRAAFDQGYVGELISDWLSNLIHPLILLLPFDVPGLPYYRYHKKAQELVEVIRGMIEQKRANLDGQTDMLAVLLQATDEHGDQLSVEELIGHTNILFVAGHETTANALSWAMLLLSQHPDVAADVQDEIDSVLKGEPPTIAQLNDLKLTEHVIKESMRLMPPVPFTGRMAMEPVEVDGIQLAAGSQVLLSHYITHRLPEIYDQPQRFMPERWQTITPSAYEYMPFSAGPRMCLGATFAMMEMKIVLPMVLQRFRLDMQPNTEVNRHVTVTMGPTNLMMRTYAQDREFQKTPVMGKVTEMVDLS